MNISKNNFKDLTVKELNIKRNKVNSLMSEFNWVELSHTKQLIDRELERRKVGNRIKNTLNKVFNGII
jgi:hypothetical protein